MRSRGIHAPRYLLLVAVTFLVSAGGIGPPARAATRAAELWVSRYDRAVDSATRLVVTPDGSAVFVTGTSERPPGDYATVAYTSSGAQLWAKQYDGPAHGDDEARALGVSPDGSAVFVTGQSVGSTGAADYATVAYGALTGLRRWVRRYDGPAGSNDTASALGVSPDGSTVFVTGSSAGPTTSSDYATVAYDAATGARLWVARYNGPANSEDSASALGVIADGSTVFVTGSSRGSTGTIDYATVAYDASTGAQLWVARYNGPASALDAAAALGVSPDGSAVFVTGRSYGSTGTIDYATVAYDASSGAQRWVGRYNDTASGDDLAWALGVSPDGSKVFVTGEGGGVGGNPDYATMAYAGT